MSTKLLLAGAVATPIGIPGAMASHTGVSHGFSFNSGVFSTLDALSALSTSANGVNGIGQIIGSFADATGAATATCCPSAHTRDTSFDTSGACRQPPPPESHVNLTKRPPCT